MTASRVAARLNVHPTTIPRPQVQYQATGSVCNHPKSGRPRQRQDHPIVLQHRRRTKTQTARETDGRHNHRISDETVRNRLRATGIRCRRLYMQGPNLTQARHQRHLQWPMPTETGLSACGTRFCLPIDESRFRLSSSDDRICVYRRTGERYSDAAVVEHDRWGGPSVMVWTGISFKSRTELVTLD